MMLSLVATFLFIVVIDSIYSKKAHNKKVKLPWVYWLSLLISVKFLITCISDTNEKFWKALILGACLRAYQGTIIDIVWGSILAFLTVLVFLVSNTYLPSSMNLPLFSLCTELLKGGGFQSLI